MTTLYELSSEYLSILNQMEEREQEIRDSGGVLPDDLQEAFEQIEGDVRDKIRNVGKMLRTLRAGAEAMDAEAKAMKARALAQWGQHGALYDYLMREMKKLGLRKVDDGWPPVRIQTNGPVSAEPVNLDLVPPEYVYFPTPKPEFDREAFLRDAAAAGVVPKEPGTVEWEGVKITKGEHLRVG